MRRRTLVLILAVIMGLSLIACSKPADTTEPAPATTAAESTEEAPQATEEAPQELTTYYAEEPFSISFALAEIPGEFNRFSEDWAILGEITNRTNVTLDVTPIIRDDYTQQISTMLSTGYNIPDLLTIQAADETKMSSFITNGLFLDYSEYYNAGLMPHMKAFFESRDLEGFPLNDDGSMYLLRSGYAKMELAGQGSYIYRKDILDELSLQLPTTTNEFYDVLTALKKAYPDSYPYNTAFKGWTAGFTATSFGVSLSGQPLGSSVHYDPVQEKYINIFETENAKAFFSFMAKLFEEKLIDPEYLTVTPDQYKQKMASDSTLVTYGWTGQLQSFNKNFSQMNPDFNMVRGSWLIADDVVDTLYIPKRQALSFVLSEAVGDYDNVEEVIKFIDWYMYSDENRTLLAWGIEGTHYTVEDDKKIATEEFIASSFKMGGCNSHMSFEM
ncbi:MAG: extracellular solute-binding protein, partial [Clostridia bacterium]|nr:extracellular solute-binding protein [Clostridia bacterium]